LPGNFFPVAGQKKGSINHCYLSVTIEQSACAPAAFVSRHDQPCGIALISERPAGGAMADNEQAEGAGAEAIEAGAPPKGKLKLIIAIVGVLAVLGGGAATYFMFFKHSGEEMHAEAPPAKPPVFVDVPDMMVNLAGAPGERVQYLKVKLILEVREEKQIEAIKPSLPRVTDIFQTYLRELRPTDLNGSAGLFRLKEELTRRVNVALAPIPVNAVLFKEVVIQ
jgi:flagellar protein FliL